MSISWSGGSYTRSNVNWGASANSTTQTTDYTLVGKTNFTIHRDICRPAIDPPSIKLDSYNIKVYVGASLEFDQNYSVGSNLRLCSSTEISNQESTSISTALQGGETIKFVWTDTTTD